MEKVLVGMSGGVDSSLSAYLLKKQGYDVEGISFVLYEQEPTSSCMRCTSVPSQCAFQSLREASDVAAHLGIPHSIIDIRREFSEKVINPFINEYMKGSTPNPCVLCNRFIKFPFLLREAKKRGAAWISTGHYARVHAAKSKKQGAERFFIKKGTDLKKDQSYVLYVLTQEELKRLILPLGSYKKDNVRAIASNLNLSMAKRNESQEICFIKDRSYAQFIKRFRSVKENPGPIMDMGCKVLGMHKGIYHYTIGQRKGLGISSPEPLYVVRIDTGKNTLYVGPQQSAKKKDFFLSNVNWIMPPPSEIFRVTVKVRSMMKDKPATLFLIPSSHSSHAKGKGKRGGAPEIVHVVFDEPQWAPAPGQSAVFYDSDIVIGGGVIIERNEEQKRCHARVKEHPSYPPVSQE